MASFFWQATFPISHIMWACGSMAQKFPCSLQSIVPCSLVMLWLGRHPIPSLPPLWQMLFPGMLIASKENVKLKTLGSGHLAQENFEGIGNWRDPAVTPQPRKPMRAEKSFPGSQGGWETSWRALVLQGAPQQQLLTTLGSHGSLPSPKTV